MVEASEIEHKFGCCSVLNHRIMWLYLMAQTLQIMKICRYFTPFRVILTIFEYADPVQSALYGLHDPSSQRSQEYAPGPARGS
jgi:hypothetical protein